MSQPIFYREISRRAMPQSKAQFDNMTVIDGEGALGRIFNDGYDVINQLPAFNAPFEKCWIELGKLQTRADKYMTDHRDNHGWYAGVIVNMLDCRGDEKRRDFPNDVKDTLAKQGAEMGWILDMTMQVDGIPSQIGMSMGTYRVLLTDKGQLITAEHEDGKIQAGIATPSPAFFRMRNYDAKNPEHVEAVQQIEGGLRIIMGDIAFAALFVLGMLNCKNVKLEANPVSRKAQKKREKHGRPDETYYFLKVTGKGARAGSNSLRVPSGQRNAMHWCRGHFRTYTDDAPLFGKVTGTFWIDSHVRGDRTSGKVDKGYEVDMMQPIPAVKEL